MRRRDIGVEDIFDYGWWLVVRIGEGGREYIVGVGIVLMRRQIIFSHDIADGNRFGLGSWVGLSLILTS